MKIKFFCRCRLFLSWSFWGLISTPVVWSKRGIHWWTETGFLTRGHLRVDTSSVIGWLWEAQVTEVLPPFTWRWWHHVQVFIITLFYVVNWKVAHSCLLRLIRIGMENKWLLFFPLISCGSRVWQPTMTVFIVQTMTPLIPVNWNTKQLFRQTQHVNAVQHSGTCFPSSGQFC
jgi:hypothetical protein